jgi:hypothetical protein
LSPHHPFIHWSNSLDIGLIRAQVHPLGQSTGFWIDLGQMNLRAARPQKQFNHAVNARYSHISSETEFNLCWTESR